MTRRRRLALIALAALAVALVVAPAALAAAGGGSSGFSGGGEGGGGGGGGSGFALFILIRLLIDIAVLGHGLGLLFLLGLAFLYWFVTRGMPKLQAWWAERAAQRSGGSHKASKRERRVELAAAEAADEDPDFAPERVRADALALFLDIEKAWDSGDRFAMRSLVSPDLLVEWERRLDDFDNRGWHNHVEPLGEPVVDYVGLTRTGDAATDRVVVKIDARVKDYVSDRSGRHLKRTGSLSEITRIR